MTTKLPKKVDGPDTVGLGYWPHQVNSMLLKELQQSYNQLIDYLTARQELEDARHKNTTSRLGVISKNQLEMKRGENPGNISLNGMKLDDVDVKEQPKRRPQHFFQIDPVDGYQIVSYGFETREAAEAYKAKLLSDNAQ